MRVIITGGTGLIGKRLAAQLAQADYEVIVLSRDPSQHAGELPAHVRAVAWDARSATGWGELADGAGTIVNLAGAGIADSRWSPARKQAILQSRRDAGRAVVEAVRAAENKPGVLVQASAVGYYDSQVGGALSESAPPGSGFLPEVCQAWEASTEAVEGMGVRRAILRSGIVLAKEGGALPKLLLPFKLFAGGPVGSGKQPMPWIHIEDEVGAIQAIIEDESARGPFNLVGPEMHDNASFSRLVGRVMQRPAFLPAPAFAMRLVFGEMAVALLEGQPAVPTKLQTMGYRFRFATAEAALRDILG